MSITNTQNINAFQDNNNNITGAAKFNGKGISCVKSEDLQKIAKNINISQEKKDTFNKEILNRSTQMMSSNLKGLDLNESKKVEQFENKQTDTEAVLREFYAINPNSKKEEISEGPIKTFGDTLQCSNQSGDVMKFGEHGTEIQFVKIPDPTLKSGFCYQLVISGDEQACLQDVANMYNMLGKTAEVIDLATGKVELNGQTFFLPPGNAVDFKDPSTRSQEALEHMSDRSQNCPDKDVFNQEGFKKEYSDAFSKFKNSDSILTSDIKFIEKMYTCVCRDRWELTAPNPPPPPQKKVDPHPRPPATPNAAKKIADKVDDMRKGNIGNKNDMIIFRQNSFSDPIGKRLLAIRNATKDEQLKKNIDTILDEDSITTPKLYSSEKKDDMKDKYANAIKNTVQYLQDHKNEAKDYEEISIILKNWGELTALWSDLAEGTRRSGYGADMGIRDDHTKENETEDLENLKNKFNEIEVKNLNKIKAQGTLVNGKEGNLHAQTIKLLGKIPVDTENVELKNAINILVNRNPINETEKMASKDEFTGAKNIVLEHLNDNSDVSGNPDRRAIVESWSNIMLELIK